jgi:non-heme chloroperoxidase
MSDQPWDGNNMDTYADDLAELIETLDLNDLVLVGHSTGGVEIGTTSAVMVPSASLR